MHGTVLYYILINSRDPVVQFLSGPAFLPP